MAKVMPRCCMRMAILTLPASRSRRLAVGASQPVAEMMMRSARSTSLALVGLDVDHKVGKDGAAADHDGG